MARVNIEDLSARQALTDGEADLIVGGWCGPYGCGYGGYGGYYGGYGYGGYGYGYGCGPTYSYYYPNYYPGGYYPYGHHCCH